MFDSTVQPSPTDMAPMKEDLVPPCIRKTRPHGGATVQLDALPHSFKGDKLKFVGHPSIRLAHL